MKKQSKKSLRTMLLERLKEFGGWVHRGTIEERVKSWGYLAENGNRTCRKLCEEGWIERKEERGSVLYRYKPQAKIVFAPLFKDNGSVELEQKTIYQ